LARTELIGAPPGTAKGAVTKFQKMATACRTGG
jgi:hypothetical protein